MPLTRRVFVASTLAAASASVARVHAKVPQPEDPAPAAPPTTHFSAITPDPDARTVVGASHANFDLVREMVTAHPSLALAAIDWGFGDWESALGAASHVGRHDIAEFLIAHGARPDIFTLTMMGNEAAVRAAIEATPGLHRLKGPHSINLADHARAGGDRAAGVLAYLLTLDGADDRPRDEPVDNAEALVGAYSISGGAQGEFEIIQGRRGLQFKEPGYSPRNLLHQGGLRFFPSGSPDVRFEFTPGSPTTPTRLSLTMHGSVIVAERRG